MNTIARTERWMPVVGYEGLYSISDIGRVRAEPKLVHHRDGRVCSRKQKLMRPAPSRLYLYLSVRLLGADGRYSTHYVHTLVLEAFGGRRPHGMEVCHCDGDRQNNRFTNLRWDTRSGNHADKNAHGTATVGERHPMRKLDNATVMKIRARRDQGASSSQLSEEFDISRMTAYRAATGKSWSHLK